MKKILGLIIILALGYVLLNAVLSSPEVSLEPDFTEEEVSVEETPVDPREPTREICVGEYCDGHMSGEDDYTTVYVALLTSGGDVGCGSKVFLAPHVVTPKTLAVLDASFDVLFDLKALPEILADDIRNVVGNETNLHYNKVVLEDGVAKLYLTGSTTTVMHCAIPDFQAQIESTAFQFDTVQTLEVYKNGELWDWCDYSDADPQESGCDTTPKLWVVSK